jgi:serine/threonine protein kinase
MDKMTEHETTSPPEVSLDDEPKTVRMKIATQSLHSAENSTVYRPTDSAALDSQYAILDKIGDGGMGVVYLARDRRLGRFVAIKRLHTSSGMSDASMKERFFQEARAVASLNHIHIVHIYSLGEDREGPFIVMEYVAGPKPATREDAPAPAYTLADRIHREGSMALDVALELLIKLCRAIEYAHACSIIHRDLKPTNVLMDESGEPKIVDFGLAQIRQPEVKPLTLPGERMLSLGYGAPEQEADASLADERADVYGLGALLYFCLTGKNPRYFRQNDLPEVLRMTVVKALETDRDKRWAEVQAFRTALMLVQSPGKMKLSTAKATWHCKWCETVNPVMIRYCGQCGWDGGVLCAECGSESRFGIQYCGVCGADAKAYENAQRVFEAMTHHMECREYGLVGQEENQIAGFRPQGVNGRGLVDRVHQVAAEAATALRRRAALHNEIKRELSAQNYEQVRRYIEEYNELAFDDAFGETAGKLDALQFERDLERLRVALKAKHWRYALRLSGDLQARGPASAELSKIYASLNRRFQVGRMLRYAGVVLLGILLYFLSGAPVYRMCGGPERGVFHVVYAPLGWVQNATVFRFPLEAYAHAYDAGGMFDQ